MDNAVHIYQTRLQQATAGYSVPNATNARKTRLWALAEEIAAITGSDPKRWLRYGCTTLERALVELKEKPGIRNRAAYATWFIKSINKKQA